MCGDARPDLAGPVLCSARLAIFPAFLSVCRAAPLPDFLAPKLRGGDRLEPLAGVPASALAFRPRCLHSLSEPGSVFNVGTERALCQVS